VRHAGGKPRHRVDRLILKTMAIGENWFPAALRLRHNSKREGRGSQRLEDNAFHLRAIGPDNPFYSEPDTRFRQRGGKVAGPLSLQSPDFASQTRRGISPSLDWPAA
jgi:hypothetical protein